jgi:uncharacterized protein DUF4395
VTAPRFCDQCGLSLIPLATPHVSRACQTCGKSVHVSEPGEGGKGFKVNTGHTFHIPPRTSIGACPLRAHVDPRLLRFSAGATASVLAVVLLIVDVARPLGLGLLASQVAVFAFTAFVSFQWSLWAQIFARFIWPRIGAPAELEDARPPRFAQFVGFVFTAVALATFVLGFDVAGYGLTALAFGVAALNASTGLCLGCKAYQLIRRLKPA